MEKIFKRNERKIFMKKRFVAIIAAALAALMLAGCNTSEDVKNTDGFIHVDNGKIVDGKGNEIWLKGIAFGNDVWTMPTSPVLTDHDESSYKDIAEMGFNCVRFYMNYQLFEDDANPYQYKESGFEWINQNIDWAKKYNVGILLNMHVPQADINRKATVRLYGTMKKARTDLNPYGMNLQRDMQMKKQSLATV